MRGSLTKIKGKLKWNGVKADIRYKLIASLFTSIFNFLFYSKQKITFLLLTMITYCKTSFPQGLTCTQARSDLFSVISVTDVIEIGLFAFSLLLWWSVKALSWCA